MAGGYDTQVRKERACDKVSSIDNPDLDVVFMTYRNLRLANSGAESP